MYIYIYVCVYIYKIYIFLCMCCGSKLDYVYENLWSMRRIRARIVCVCVCVCCVCMTVVLLSNTRTYYIWVYHPLKRTQAHTHSFCMSHRGKLDYSHEGLRSRRTIRAHTNSLTLTIHARTNPLTLTVTYTRTFTLFLCVSQGKTRLFTWRIMK